MAAKVHNELFDIPLEERDKDEIKDGYQLKFVGKDYAKLQAGLKTETIITPDTAHNSKPENANSENIFITGDNLDALKHLENAYSGKVDVIYIDPPYNTGSDGFVYADNFKFSDDDFKEKLNLTEEEISRVRALSGKSSHPAWLTFMLPRLMVAKRLLSDTGVIFISIDDNEQANLKMLCDEIFNEQNTLSIFVWQKINGGKNNTKLVNSNHEYILAYSKNINNTVIEGDKKTNLKDYKNTDNDPRGIWTRISMLSPSYNPKNRFEMVFKNGKAYTPSEGHSWLYSREKMLKMEEDNRISFEPNMPRKKTFLSETGKMPAKSLILQDIGGNNQQGTTEISDIFGDKTFFSFPKPTKLIKYLTSKCPNKSSLILDFFAGSATTADAVMQLNKEDGGNRKYILVQLPEKVSKNSEAEKAGYKTIDQISRERIERAATKIGDNSGFKHFRLTTPNDENTLSKLEEFNPNANVVFPEDMTTTFDGGEKAILQTWLIDDGFEFNQTPKIVEFAGYQAHYIEQRLYLISTGWSSEATRELLNTIGKNKLAVQSIVIFPYSFTFNELNELKINLRTAFEKSNKIELLERY
jgi:hypothetical protein